MSGAIDAREKEALAALDSEYERRRAEIRGAFDDERRKSQEPEPQAQPPPAPPSPPPPAPPAPPAPAAPAAPASGVGGGSPGGSGGAKLTLWEREQLEAEQLEADRASRVEKLNAQRQREQEEARQRELAWKQEEDAKAAAEMEAREKQLAAMRLSQAEAVERGNRERAATEAEMAGEQERAVLQTGWARARLGSGDEQYQFLRSHGVVPLRTSAKLSYPRLGPELHHV